MREKTVIVRLSGGLGNQMFQYAAARRLALVNDATLKLDLGWFDDVPPGATPRRYELDVFRIAGAAASPEEVRALRGKVAEKWPKLPGRFPRLARILSGGSYLREERFRFEAGLLRRRGDAYLEGCWQSPAYFQDVEEAIRRDFTFRTPPTPRNAEVAERIGSCQAVSLHVRRGDYVSDEKTRGYHGVSPLRYYEAAMGEVVAKVGRPHFFVFSDDPAWVKENLHSDMPLTFVEHNGPESGHEDLRLMSLCRHHIIANSTFSWWGAWLNGNPGKLVFAPRRWFGCDGPQCDDLIPGDWRRV